MAKKITAVGYTIPGHSETEVKFSSGKSLMDSDIILFSPELPYYERDLSDNGLYQGKVCYGQNGSFRLKEDVAHWKKELGDSLKAGKTVFVLLSRRSDYYVDTGSRTYSGTGRNRKTTINVTSANNYETLPISTGRFHAAAGKEILPPLLPIFKSFYDYFRDHLEYFVYLENVATGGQVIFTGKDKTKALGVVYNVGAGHLVLLPYITYDEVNFTEVRENESGKQIEYWTDVATTFGNVLVSKLIDIDRSLRSSGDGTPAPEWALNQEYKSERERVIDSEIQTHIDTISAIEEKLRQLQTELDQDIFLKELLYGQGKSLENAVTIALTILGFKAENFSEGELEFDQVIVSPEGERFIGECEGRDSAAISIDKFRQLEENIQSDLQREQVEAPATGILFGNGYRLAPPSQRQEQFTAKCLASAKRGTILVRTADLYPVIRHLQKKNDAAYAEACRKAISGSQGGIVTFPLPPEK